jgi:hypothetical protein
MTFSERLERKLRRWKERQRSAAERRAMIALQKKRRNLLRGAALRACLSHRRRYGFPKPGCTCRVCYQSSYSSSNGTRLKMFDSDEAMQMLDGGVG